LVEPPKAARRAYSEARANSLSQKSKARSPAPPASGSLKNPADLVARLELLLPERVLLIDVPRELAALVENARAADKTTLETSGDAIRSVKEKFDAILVWREDRSGSRSIFESAVGGLEPGGVLWVVTAMKKVRGPKTPAVHRLELSDLVKGFGKNGLANDREVRVSGWNVAYRFVGSGSTLKS